MFRIEEIKAMSRQDPRFLSLLRLRMERSFLAFVLIMFPLVYGLPFLLNRHHRVIIRTLERVYGGEIKRLILNLPPGYGKTELVVIMFAAWCIAKEPRSRFLHTSYSDDLALLNSSSIKDIINSEIFQLLWPLKIRTDSKAKKLWTIEEHGGSFTAVPMSGQVTGRRAGVLSLKDIFSGALIIDDPLKPDDANSIVTRQKANSKFKSTIRNRVAREDIPVIIVMQRLHKSDLCGFLLEGGTKEKWHHLIIPADIRETGIQPKNYKKEWAYGIPIKYKAETGPLWTVKHAAEDLKNMELADLFIYMSQYMQDPTNSGMSIFGESWWRFYKTYDPVKGTVTDLDKVIYYLTNKSIYADTAMKTGERHDYSVFQCWAKDRKESKIFLLDQLRSKWEAPDLESEFTDFIKRHQFVQGEVLLGLRAVKVEDKASGTGLIQTVNRNPEIAINIEGIQRNKDKISRAKSSAPSVKRGEVWLPLDAEFLAEFLEEHAAFNEHMTHDHDDQVDCTMDAIHDMLLDDSGGYDWVS